MQNDVSIETTPPGKTPTANPRATGAGYGVFFGLGFALWLWGYDASVLARASADLAWGQFAVGLPCALLIGGVTGYVGARLPAVGWTALLWAFSLGALTWLAGHAPFEGYNFVAGLTDARFAGITLRPYTDVNQVRTLLTLIPNTILGFAVGYLQTLAMDAAWDYTDARGRMRLRSWLALMTGLLIAIAPAVIVHLFVMQPFRAPQVRLANLVATTLAGGVEAVRATGQNVIEAENYGAQFTPSYTIQFAEFATLTEESSYVTVIFNSGFALQCIIMGDQVTFCENLSEKYDARIGALAYSGLTGEQRWRSDPRKNFFVEDTVVAWLREHRGQLSENYHITRIEQRGPLALVAAQFDTSFKMTCRFSGAAITHATACKED